MSCADGGNSTEQRLCGHPGTPAIGQRTANKVSSPSYPRTMCPFCCMLCAFRLHVRNMTIPSACQPQIYLRLLLLSSSSYSRVCESSVRSALMASEAAARQDAALAALRQLDAHIRSIAFHRSSQRTHSRAPLPPHLLPATPQPQVSFIARSIASTRFIKSKPSPELSSRLSHGRMTPLIAMPKN